MLVDTNLLVYATFAGMPEHQPARSWLEERLSGGEETIVLCWPVLYAFVRLVTNARIFRNDTLSIPAAWRLAAEFTALPGTRLVTAGPRHAAIAAELAAIPGLRSEDVPDIELAALAIEHGLVLASRDHGFRRFAALRFVDPLT